MQFVKPIPFTEAIEKLDQKTLIGSGLNSDQWANVPLALRERAFFSSRIESIRFLQRGRDSIADFLQGSRETLANGDTVLMTGRRADFIKQMQDFAKAEGLGPIDPDDEGSIKDIRSERRLGLIFDIQTRQSSDFGYWKQGMDPDVLNEYPAMRFFRETEVKKERDTHRLHENEVHLKTDLNFWTSINRDFGVPWGPWGWGCGHATEDVDREETERLGLLEPGQRVTPPDSEFNQRLEASISNLDPDFVDQLRAAFGDQVAVTGDSVAWQKQEPAPVPPPEPPVPAPRPAPRPSTPEPDPAAPTPSAPVSVALDVSTSRNAPALKEALEVIDQVHDDGALPRIEVDSSVQLSSANGTYFPRAPRISIKVKKGQEFTFFHEIGHFLDHQALGQPGRFASDESPDLAEWRNAVANTALVATLKKDLPRAFGRQARAIYYLLSLKELWARSYSQWMASKVIAGKIGRKTLQQDLTAALAERRETPYGGHWSDDDFKPVSAAIEKLFKKKGWL